ncbi:Transglycosylase SLT domain protein [compost metagenome]
MAGQWWDSAPKVDPFEAAISLEGLDPNKAAIARSIYQQESGSGRNTTTSNAGAVGGMQIIPGTFNRMADKGWDINDPLDNARAGVRYVNRLYELAEGDPRLTAAGYYGGEGAIPKAKAGQAVSDPRNPNAPNTLQYADQVASRLAPQQSDDAWWMSAPLAESQGAAATSRGPDGVLRVEMGGTAPATAEPVSDNSLVALGAGLGSGVGQVALGAQEWLGKGMRGLGMEQAGNWLVDDAQSGRRKLAGEVAPYKEVSPWAAGGGELAGNIAATLPVGGILGRGVSAIAPNLGRVAPSAEKLANALRSGGMNLGGTPATTVAGQVGNLATRMAGGAGTGAVSAGLVDPEAVGSGALIGAVLPPAMMGVGKAAGAAGAALQPFFAGGQKTIVGNTLREFSDNPQAASSALKYATEVVPGSTPTTAMAAGDAGLAALSRSMQGANLEYAGQLAARQTAQNQARTAAMEAVAGNPGKIATAKAARDALTAPMRESVLDAAGQVPSDGVLRAIDRLISNPSNAGKLSQQALNEFKGRIAQFTQDGAIDARALYAIRKDIGDVLGGKLQGEAGNIRYASSQLIKVRELIDDAIDKASRAVNAPGTAVMPFGANIERAGMTGAAQGPRTSWKEYLKTYADESMPINQMEKLDDVLKRIQNSRVDQRGSLELSGAKLNNILKNEGADLAKVLSPDQMALLRNLSADLNAAQLAESAGRMVGSSTFQNLAQNNLMTQALGSRLGGSTPVQATLGRLLQLPYGLANQGIQEKLAQALLNPRQASALLADPKNSKIVEALQRLSAPTARAVPVISAQ